MHNKVVYRAAQALTRAGYDTLRFNFRGVGLSEGRYDAGRGEVEDFRAALDEAERTVGAWTPIVAGGFSFGSAVGLKASAQDRRLAAFVALGLPLATESGRLVPRPPASVPSLFVVGENDTFGPPGGSGALSRRDASHGRHSRRGSLLRRAARDPRGDHRRFPGLATGGSGPFGVRGSRVTR